jgi:hypothetical protein
MAVGLFCRHKSVFPAEYEKLGLLLLHILEMEKAFLGFTTSDIRRLAFDLAKNMNLSHPKTKKWLVANG